MLNNNPDAPGHPVHNYQSRQKVKKSLKLAVLDGGAYAAMLGLTQNYITPFALALKATTAQVGLLSSVPNLVMALSQLAAPNLADRAGSRKGLILPAVFFHALVWLPLFILPYLFQASGVWWLTAFVTISLVCDALSNPPWGSMMADLVHEDLRGRYFAFRGRIAGFITLVLSLIAGAVLQYFTGRVFIGFAIIFGGAMLFRFLSFFFLARMYEPPLTAAREAAPTLPRMVRSLGASNLGRFTVYMALIYFGMMISGPFFSVFMIRDLHFGYLTYTIVASASIVSNLLSLGFWGRRADRAGNMKIIRITSWLMPVVPALWLVSGNPVYLVATNIFSGFVWSGFNLASWNFLYDASEPGYRTRQIALYNSATGIAFCFGALAGGYLAPFLPEVLGYKMRTLFTISGLLRGAIVVLLLPGLHEVRRVADISALRVFFGRGGTDKDTGGK